MHTINTIKDTRVRIKVSSEFADILKCNEKRLKNIPKTILESLDSLGISLSTAATEPDECTAAKLSGVDVQLLNNVLENDLNGMKTQVMHSSDELEKSNASKDSIKTTEILLYLSDLRWLNQVLHSLRSDGVIDVYLNDILETCHLDLPHNELIERNPELEARCQRLREEQQNREYRNMTKNVDATLKHYPEDTVAYQMKAINSQVIAVLQFIFSVAAGFVFGFLGIELIIGDLDFGLRLLLGIMFALIIALAEIYFLAKKLNEYDNTVDTANKAINKTIPAKVRQQTNKKAHVE